MSGVNPTRSGSPRGKCSNCGKRGLGKAHPSSVLTSSALFRDCQYCGHKHMFSLAKERLPA